MATVRDIVPVLRSSCLAGLTTAALQCMLYRLHVLQNTPSSLVDINGMKHEEDELRARADEYFQVALDQLSRQPIPLAVKLQALMDLYSHQVSRDFCWLCRAG